jgi:hypothetical protein
MAHVLAAGSLVPGPRAQHRGVSGRQSFTQSGTRNFHIYIFIFNSKKEKGKKAYSNP